MAVDCFSIALSKPANERSIFTDYGPYLCSEGFVLSLLCFLGLFSFATFPAFLFGFFLFLFKSFYILTCK